MKKASLPINYIFLIFIGVIVMFVIIALVTNWSLSAKRYVKGITGEKTEEDIQMIVTNNVATEIDKHKKLCEARCKIHEVKSNLCYAITDERSKTVLISCKSDGTIEVINT